MEEETGAPLIHIHLLQLGRVSYAEGLRLQAEVVVAMELEATVEELMFTIHANPTKRTQRLKPSFFGTALTARVNACP